MAANNPQIELETIWGYTKEEIERRWKIHQKFDVVSRLFGSSSDSDKGAQPPPVVNNSEQTLAILERMLTSADLSETEEPEEQEHE